MRCRFRLPATAGNTKRAEGRRRKVLDLERSQHRQPATRPRRSWTILHTEFSKGWGGQEMRTVEEARLVAARGHRVILVARPECRILPHAQAAGLPTHALGMRHSADLTAVLGLCRLLRRERADLINTHSSVDSWLGAFAARITRVKLVRTRHVSIPIRKNPLNFVHRMPDAMITTGESVRRRILADGILPAERVISIPTGIDVERFAPGPDDGDLRRRLAIPAGAPVIAMVAVLREKKRHDVLLRAVALLRNRFDPHCLLAGEGSRREAIERLRADLGLESRVFLLGHQEDVRPVLRAASVVVSASAGMEGVPQALIQALAMERPVVATDDGSVSELIEHERTGLLVPLDRPEALAAAVERLLVDRAEAARLAAQGRAHVLAHYSDERMAARVIELYEKLLS
jgi:glycosyltransferase involved in cell wall biosynthesis